MTIGTYKVLAGYDHVLGDLVDIDPQPSSPGLQYGRRQFSASGKVIDELANVPLLFDLPLQVTQVAALNTQFAFGTATTAEVTVLIPLEDGTDILRNAIAVKPLMGEDGQRSGYFIYGYTILLKNLVVQA